MQDKAELIYRGIIIILFVVFLAIFYQYSENGRYTYHKEIEENLINKYVVDTRSATIYGICNRVPGTGYFYKMELQTSKMWFTPVKIIEKLPEEAKQSPSK